MWKPFIYLPLQVCAALCRSFSYISTTCVWACCYVANYAKVKWKLIFWKCIMVLYVMAFQNDLLEHIKAMRIWISKFFFTNKKFYSERICLQKNQKIHYQFSQMYTATNGGTLTGKWVCYLLGMFLNFLHLSHLSFYLYTSFKNNFKTQEISSSQLWGMARWKKEEKKKHDRKL